MGHIHIHPTPQYLGVVTASLEEPENYQRIFLAQGFTRVDFENGCSDHLVDTMIPWGSEEHIRERIDAHFAAGASHVCLMPLRCDEPSLPDERLLEAFALR